MSSLQNRPSEAPVGHSGGLRSKEGGLLMHRIIRKPRLIAAGLAAIAIAAGALLAAGSAASSDENSYTVHNLVSDQAGVADHQDPNLVNAWGIAASSSSPWW